MHRAQASLFNLPLPLPSPRFLPLRRLPGEAQKIDRIMEKFAERYCRDNPAAFKTGGGLGGWQP